MLMLSGERKFIEEQSLGILQRISAILQDLSNDLDRAALNNDALDVQALGRIARELRANHDTLVTLSRVHGALQKLDFSLS